MPGFFKGYKRMRDNQAGLNEILEQPAILSLIPDVKGAAVLDLGCGAGDLCRKIKSLGAAKVTGVDISANMIELAAQNPVSGITFINKAMEDAEFEPDSFDLVISSLAFHYVADLEPLFKIIYRWLKQEGIFLFSTEHPIFTSSQGIHHGWVKDVSGKKLYWPLDKYSLEGKRESHWFVKGVIKYHRTVSTILNTIINSGFIIKSVMEPTASEEEEQKNPVLKDINRRPPFLIVKAQK